MIQTIPIIMMMTMIMILNMMRLMTMMVATTTDVRELMAEKAVQIP